MEAWSRFGEYTAVWQRTADLPTELLHEDWASSAAARCSNVTSALLSLAESSFQFFFFDRVRRATYSPRHPWPRRITAWIRFRIGIVNIFAVSS
jgi:hypothetical protein